MGCNQDRETTEVEGGTFGMREKECEKCEEDMECCVERVPNERGGSGKKNN